jgi:hypothetical protein
MRRHLRGIARWRWQTLADYLQRWLMVPLLWPGAAQDWLSVWPPNLVSPTNGR